MNLAQLVNFFASKSLNPTADYFRSCANDSVTVDGLIDSNFVKRHVIFPGGFDESFWREIQANVTSYIGYNPKYYQNPCTGEQWTKEQWDEYVQWEESRIEEDKKYDCEDCYGCEKCEG